jgi:hypothetical protein
MFMRLFGEGEISEKSKVVGLQIASAAKAAISLNWKELRLRGTPEPLPASSTSPIARMTDAPTLAIAGSRMFEALANSASAYGSGGRPVFGSTNNDPVWPWPSTLPAGNWIHPDPATKGLVHSILRIASHLRMQ